MAHRSVIRGCGGYLPPRILTNTDLAETYGLDTSDAWIVERTGIRQRHLAGPEETASSMAALAAARALDQAGIPASAVDLVIVATATPDSAFPATAARVQAALGITQGMAFDISVACAGYVFALGVADSLMTTGQANCALVIGSEVFSRILDWEDRTTCVLFGDGAGAVVMRREEVEDGPRAPGLLSTHLHTDGRQGDILKVEGGGGASGPYSAERSGVVRMAGKEVFRMAVGKLAAVVEEALAANNLQASDVDWLVPHQANLRIIDGMGRKLHLPPERVVVTVDRHANTSAASIPLALAEAVGDGRIGSGDLVLMEAIGGGMSWGACLVRM